MIEQLEKSIKSFEALTMEAEIREKLYRYNDALMQSIHSIIEDSVCDYDSKMQLLTDTLDQYASAMKELFPDIIKKNDDEPPQEEPHIENPPVISKSNPNRFIEIEEIEKFNPYHDSLGRFTTANSATSFTYKPGQGAMYDNAIAREKERDAASGGGKQNNPLGDPDSIGGAERGEPMTREQANSNHVNPMYFKERGYQTNCQSCVVAYEARLRGYDVQAKANTKNSTAEKLSRDTRLAWKDPATGKTPDYITNEKVTTAKRCRTWLEETIQPGERYTFQHGWKGRKYNGHIVSADKDTDGSLRLYDPQNGKTMKGADIDSYLSRTKLTMTVYGTKMPRAKLLRVDNLQIDSSIADGIMEAKK